MPMWRCPHCGTPQPEAARCWVCRRSSTTCSTCRQFRRAVAGRFGYCGLDRRRAPLTGLELRGCWEAAEVAVPGASAGSVSEASPPSPRDRLRRDFVLVEAIVAVPELAPSRTLVADPDPPVPATDGATLFGDR